VLPLFTSGRARLVDSRKLVTQFATLERRTSAGGRDSVDHGRNSHDDLCNAVAGALTLLSVDQIGMCQLATRYMERTGRIMRPRFTLAGLV